MKAALAKSKFNRKLRPCTNLLRSKTPIEQFSKLSLRSKRKTVRTVLKEIKQSQSERQRRMSSVDYIPEIVDDDEDDRYEYIVNEFNRVERPEAFI